MENAPFEDVFPIEDGDFPLLCYVSLPEGKYPLNILFYCVFVASTWSFHGNL